MGHRSRRARMVRILHPAAPASHPEPQAERPLPLGSGLRPVGSLTLIIPDSVAKHSNVNLASCRPRDAFSLHAGPAPRPAAHAHSLPALPAPPPARPDPLGPRVPCGWPGQTPPPEGDTLLLGSWGGQEASELLGNPEGPERGSTWVVGSRTPEEVDSEAGQPGLLYTLTDILVPTPNWGESKTPKSCPSEAAGTSQGSCFSKTDLLPFSLCSIP